MCSVCNGYLSHKNVFDISRNLIINKSIILQPKPQALSSPSLLSSTSSSTVSTSLTPSTKYFSKKRLELVLNLAIWYAISAFYNIYNKRALNILKSPWFVATFQMFAGTFIFIPLWILNVREKPFVNKDELIESVNNLKFVALFNTLTHIAGNSYCFNIVHYYTIL